MYNVYLYAEDPKLKDNMIKDNELLVEELGGVSEAEEELRFRRPRKIVKRKRLFIVLFIILGLIVAGAASFGIYMLFRPEEPYDDSAAFYLSSDLLSEEGGEFVVYDTIDFSVYNYADSLRVSKEPIEDFGITVKVDGKDITPKTEITAGDKVMPADERSGCEVSIKVPEKYRDKTVEVIVKSSPVPKEIKASFRIEPAWGYSVYDEKGLICAELVIFANKDTALELNWNGEKLIPDSTNPYIRTAKDGENKCRIQLTAGMSTTIPLFKADPEKDYSDDTRVLSLESVEYIVTEDKNDQADETSEITEETEEVGA